MQIYPNPTIGSMYRFPRLCSESSIAFPIFSSLYLYHLRYRESHWSVFYNRVRRHHFGDIEDLMQCHRRRYDIECLTNGDSEIKVAFTPAPLASSLISTSIMEFLGTQVYFCKSENLCTRCLSLSLFLSLYVKLSLLPPLLCSLNPKPLILNKY